MEIFWGPHDLQPQSLDVGVYEESDDEPWVHEGAPGAEVLDSIDDGCKILSPGWEKFSFRF